MNNYQNTSRPYVDNYVITTTTNLSPSETELNRGPRYPVTDMKGGSISPINRDVTTSYPTPNTLETMTDNPPRTRNMAKHRSCRYNFSSWIPELFCCFIGILAFTGMTHNIVYVRAKTDRRS